MTTASLANTYRPKRLGDLIGQDVLSTTLTGAIENNRVAHAYIFTGIRGVGKTTAARALARSLNCEAGPTPTPCLTCVQCRAIDADRHPDVLEIDAASTSSVDDVRQQIQSIGTAPMMGRYRVRIIDEAHGLSAKAWEAFLKTIEEPPPHEIFIFATTESRKIPSTVRSRCQIFALLRISQENLQAHLDTVAAQAGITTEPGATALLARMANGSMRDGLTLLGQARDSQPGAITPVSVAAMLGLPAFREAVGVLGASLRQDARGVLTGMQALLDRGITPEGLGREMLEAAYLLTVAAVDPAMLTVHGVSAEDISELVALVRHATPKGALAAYTELSKTLIEMKESPSPESALEIALLRLCWR